MATLTAQAQDFVDALVHDSSLQTQYTIASPNSLDGVVDFANNKGYMITRDELKAALKQYGDNPMLDQLRQFVR
jgi:hypothetical protein